MNVSTWQPLSLLKAGLGLVAMTGWGMKRRGRGGDGCSGDVVGGGAAVLLASQCQPNSAQGR